MADLTPMTQSLGQLLKTHKHTVAVAESSTGGLISAALLAVPGASAFFVGGGVIYTLESRRTLLAVPDEAVAGIRASTEEYALRMARVIRERMGTTWGLAMATPRDIAALPLAVRWRKPSR
jgi:nicotinamide-nucleotide amidase